MKNSQRSFALLLILVSSCAKQQNAADIASVNSAAEASFGGFDPGLNLKYAAGTTPSKLETYSEFCEKPDGTKFSCSGTIPSGKGFYTIAYGEGVLTQTCRPNSASPYTPLGQTVTVPCPYYFHWGNESGRPIAQIMVDSRQFPMMSNFPNLSNAIMQNIPAGIHAGLDANSLSETPYIRDVESIEFELRAKICRKKFESDPVGMARMYTYISWGDRANTAVNQQLAVNLGASIKAPQEFLSNIPIPLPARPVLDEEELGGPPGTGVAVHVNGAATGLTDAYEFSVDNSDECSGTWDSIPFHPFKINMAQALKVMGPRLKPEALANGRVYSLMMGGVEVWGRMQVSIQLKNYRVRLKAKNGVAGSSLPPQSNGAVNPPVSPTTSAAAPNAANSYVGVKCNTKGGAAGKVSVLDGGVKIVCLEDGSGGFAWQILNSPNLNGAQCKTLGAQQQNFTCRQFPDSPSGFRWLP